MTVTAIIAEYNPFHNGHQRLARAAREAGGEGSGVVAVLSGNWLQRGEPALLPKGERVQAALLSGVDLVVELPLPYAAATAERFAYGGVALAEALGCVDRLAFGCEAGELLPLEQCAAALLDPGVDAAIREGLGEGLSYAAARQRAVAACLGEEAAAPLSRPNDTLAVQYLYELKRRGSAIRPLPVLRQGAGHHSAAADEVTSTASASWIRGRFLAGEEEVLRPYLPPASWEGLEAARKAGRWADPARLELPLLAALRRMAPQDYAALPDLSEGLEHRLQAAVREGTSLQEVLERAGTRRYPQARVRRILLAAYLGIPKETSRQPPPYLRVLGMNKTGIRILAKAKKTASLPIFHSLARLERQGGRAGELARLEARSTDLYGLLYEKPVPCGTDYTNSIAIV